MQCLPLSSRRWMFLPASPCCLAASSRWKQVAVISVQLPAVSHTEAEKEKFPSPTSSTRQSFCAAAASESECATVGTQRHGDRCQNCLRKNSAQMENAATPSRWLWRLRISTPRTVASSPYARAKSSTSSQSSRAGGASSGLAVFRAVITASRRPGWGSSRAAWWRRRSSCSQGTSR